MPEPQQHPAPKKLNPDVVIGEDGLSRPRWAATDELMRTYYDEEWGVPITDEQGMFERICLEGFQAGLSWRTVLVKRDALREDFLDFNPDAVALLTDEDVARIKEDPRIIRSEAKIRAVIKNARATLALRQRAQSLREQVRLSPDVELPAAEAALLGFTLPNGMQVDDGLPALIWSYGPEQTPTPQSFVEVPTRSAESENLARRLKKEGFSFVGPTTVYAMFEACGVVDTHLLDSHRRGVSQLWNSEGIRRSSSFFAR